ncbi:serine hydrolase [Kribbella sp. NPDC026596]|uniref:serine hydrolase n=1 Tax=Kribbella sp. NPDC026596 TaxID=3155122 RepID=UPI0033F2D5C2
MTGLGEVGKWLGEYVPAAIARHEVPGVAWAVLAGGEVLDGAAGVLSKATEVEATADSVFQIGSIAKLWTGTLDPYVSSGVPDRRRGCRGADTRGGSTRAGTSGPTKRTWSS